MKASENEIFFVEDDVEPNTEGQLNDIPTKLELRTNDLDLIFISGPQHQPHTLLIKLTNFGQNYFFFLPELRSGVHRGDPMGPPMHI